VSQVTKLAMQLPYPVKLIWSREEEIAQGAYRPQSAAVLKANVTANKRIAAFSNEYAQTESAESETAFLHNRHADPRVARTKDLQDTPIPSGNAMLAWVLLRIARTWGDDELERRAVSVFRLVEPALRRAPGAFAWALCGFADAPRPFRTGLWKILGDEQRHARAYFGRAAELGRGPLDCPVTGHFWNYRERLTTGRIAGIVLCLAGVAAVFAKGRIENLLSVQFTEGDLWIAAASACWGLYSVLLKARPSALEPLTRSCPIPFATSPKAGFPPACPPSRSR